MNKDFNTTYQKQYNGDSVIERGYEIYDEWIKGDFSSRRIVGFTERAVASMQANRTSSAYVEVLSCLFALDMRIRETYNTLLRCLFSYFAWRRETRTLKRLKSTFDFPSGEEDVRTMIEVALQKLREKVEAEESDDGDDETRGGKRNGKAEEETIATEEKNQEQAPEENAEEITDAEEAKESSEETAEDISEQTPTDEPIQESEEAQETVEPTQEESEIAEKDEKEQIKQEEKSELKEENNVPDTESEPSTDKKEEAKTYNDAVDSPPLYEETVSERTAEKTSFIDEMIIDNMVKGDKSIIGYQRIDEAERLKEADIPQDTVATQKEENKSTDKDAYLYDTMIATDKGEAQQTLNAESEKPAEKVSETKTEQPKETMQNNDNVNSNKQEVKPLSEMLQSDNPNVDPDNHIADALNAHMSLESKMALIRMQEDQLREHISITLEELGMNDTSDVLRVSEPDAVSPPRAVQNSK